MRILKHSSYPLALLIAAIVVLAMGIGFRTYQTPRPLSESNLALQPAATSPGLNELPQSVTDAAAHAARQLLYLSTAPHTAVMWNTTRAVGSVELAQATRVTSENADGKTFELEPVTVASQTPIAYWAVGSEAAVAPVEQATSSPGTDDWVIAVGRGTRDHVIFSEGLYRGTSPARCGTFDYQQVNATAILSSALLGGGVFTLQGSLLGVIVACGGEPVVVSTGSIEKAIRMPVFVTDYLQQVYGIGVIEAKPEAVVVSTVWKGRPADIAGIETGDRIREVDGAPVHILADLDIVEKGSVGAPHALVLTRGKRELRTTLLSQSEDPERPQTTAVDGMTLTASARSGNVLVDSIAADSIWAKSGLQAGDVLVRVNGSKVRDPAEAAQKLVRQKRASSIAVEIERGPGRAEVRLSYE